MSCTTLCFFGFRILTILSSIILKIWLNIEVLKNYTMTTFSLFSAQRSLNQVIRHLENLLRPRNIVQLQLSCLKRSQEKVTRFIAMTKFQLEQELARRYLRMILVTRSWHKRTVRNLHPRLPFWESWFQIRRASMRTRQRHQLYGKARRVLKCNIAGMGRHPLRIYRGAVSVLILFVYY